jgi:hypothetical protein
MKMANLCVPTVYNFDPKLFASNEPITANSNLTVNDAYTIWVDAVNTIKNDVLQYLNAHLNGDTTSKQNAVASINSKLQNFVQQTTQLYNLNNLRVVMRNPDGVPRAGASTIPNDPMLTQTQLRTPDIQAQVLKKGFVSTTKTSSSTSQFETQFSKALDSFNPCSDTLAAHTFSIYITK